MNVIQLMRAGIWTLCSLLLINTILIDTVQAKPNQTEIALEQTDFTCSDVSEIPQAECEALVALYTETDGPNWALETSWLMTTTPCSWFGVTCENGHVTELQVAADALMYIPDFGLKGAVPPEIGNLTHLTHLHLWGSQLESLPAEIGNLTNLTSLNIANNKFQNLPT